MEENQHASHADGKRDWQAEWGSQFSMLGSKDEPPATRPAESQYPRTGAYRLCGCGLPAGWESPSGYLVCEGVRFAYG
ncbi:hypothetical protein [Candidatus Methylacidithermus pantelleriae]|uniref:Uncharacterized protein n=1 Tax=Candidatus Methylacidithermus pantelleriae TaxID=2744239 RepID=A0A8J2BQM1_9BACT|nr:hypothetical protein [Candidatus Methylacidithermus pantelleriae]CAF0699244.1 hypothetical protein MPNT_30172 [Candidatus Methylacidithermus pantelleriae]